MNDERLILVKTICIQYEVENSFIEELSTFGLISLQLVENEHYLEVERIGHLEKMIRLHQDLNINLEGIDVILNLMEKIENLQKELIQSRNRLILFEN